MKMSEIIENNAITHAAVKRMKYGVGIRHLQIVCMMLTIMTLFIARTSMAVAVLAMSQANPKNPDIQVFDWDKKTQSLILSSFYWGYVAIQLPAGILAKRFGGKPVLAVALLSNTLIFLLVPTCAAWGEWMLVCACRAGMGLTQACLFTSTHTLVGQWLPDNERTSYSGIIYGGAEIGTILSMPLSGILADSSIGWKLIFYVVAGILFVNFIIWYSLAGSSPREHRMISKEEKEYIEAGLNIHDNKAPTPWRHILRSKRMWVVLGPHMGFVLSYVFFSFDMPTYLEKGLGMSLKDSALLSGLPYIGTWIGSLSSTFISEKLCNKGILKVITARKIFQSLSLFGIATLLVILSFLGAENKSLAVATLIGCLTLSGFSSAGCLMTLFDLSPNYAGVMLCLISVLANIGNVGMPIATSHILQNDPTDLSRWKIVFFVMSAICVIANIVFLLFGTADRQQWDDPTFLKMTREGTEESIPLKSSEELSEDAKGNISKHDLE